MKIIKFIFWNPWSQTLFFLILCFIGTYWIVANFFDILRTFIDIRKKEFWATLGVVVPIMFLLPTFINMVLFAKIVQIADNTKKTCSLLQEHLKTIEKIK